MMMVETLPDARAEILSRPSAPRVSVVCLSYNRPHLLHAALSALTAQTYPHLDVAVIDNDSPLSGEVADIVAKFPPIRLVRSGGNLGFSGGMNLGIRQADGDYVCLTEDDIILEPDFVSRMVDYFSTQPHTGLAGGLLLNHESGTILCAGGGFRLEPLFRFWLNAENEPDRGQLTEPCEVSFISGCMMFAHREFLAGQLRGFRDEFFLYYEDLDLCQRTLAAGRSVVVVPTARGRHVEPPPGPSSRLVEYHKYKNFYSVYFLHASVKVLPGFVLRYGLWAVLRNLLRGRFHDCWTILMAWGYVLPRIPALCRERRAPLSYTTKFPRHHPCAS